MASPQEMLALLGEPALRENVEAALWLVADAIRTEDQKKNKNHAQRVAFARRVFTSPDQVHAPIMRAVIAQFPDLTASQIKGLSANAVKDAVAAVVDLFAEPQP